MKKALIIVIVLFSFCDIIHAQTEDQECVDSTEFVNLDCQEIEQQEPNNKPHRTPPRIPIVYFNRVEFSLVFDSPCYDCTLYLVEARSNTVVYTTLIPFGRDIVYIPSYFSGEYELHIHRGNYCFSGWLDL